MGHRRRAPLTFPHRNSEYSKLANKTYFSLILTNNFQKIPIYLNELYASIYNYCIKFKKYYDWRYALSFYLDFIIDNAPSVCLRRKDTSTELFQGSVSFAQWQYHNQWGSPEMWSLLVENFNQCPAAAEWNNSTEGNCWIAPWEHSNSTKSIISYPFNLTE